MDPLFEDKLSLLQLYYPVTSRDVLQDLLISCDGDLDATRSLIDGKPRPKKRSAPAQAALTSFIPGNSQSNKRFRAVERTSHSEPGNPFVSDAIGGKKPRNVSKVITLNTPSDVKEHLYPYASLHLNFLPEPLIKSVQESLLSMKEHFSKNKFYLFGNLCESNSSMGLFSRPSATYTKLVYNGLKRPTPFEYSKGMEDLARYVERYLNEKIIPNADRLKWQSRDDWTNDFCVVNCYEKLQNNMDWHSDRLSHIGPHNYVASISIGTTRMFRLRSTYKESAPIYQVPLPHNSLFIMRPGCQEEFKHCLSPMSKAIDVHPVLGTLRFGITARCYPTFFI
ncbi:hypothetical protein OXX80_010918, partial [Metschnikowia pulcherrima]